MTPDDPSGTRPSPVVLRIKLRYDDVETMVQRFAPNVGKSGLFLPTRSLQPIGAEVKFELRLSNDQPVLVGLGRVKLAREPDAQDPKAIFGMGIELMRVTRESRELILRMLERRRRLGLADVGVPLPEDVEAARRADLVESAVKEAVSTGVPALGPEPEGLLTSPRRVTGPIAVSRSHVVEPLSAEPPRRRRPLVSELIESASGPIGAVVVPGLDDDVDVPAVLARARVLATGDLDRELEALREESAAPLLEITIEAASAELARQLGGAAVRRDRNQRWAPPPAVATAEPEDVIAEAVAAITAALADASAPVAQVDDRIESPSPDSASTASRSTSLPPLADDEPELELERAPPSSLGRRIEPSAYDDDDEDLSPGVIERNADDAGHLIASDHGPQPDEHEVDDGQIDDEIHQLSESDFEEVENTQVGPDPAFDRGYTGNRAEAAVLAERLDAQLAEAEAEADADDLGISARSPLFQARAPSDDYEEMSSERAISVGGEYESAHVEHRPRGATDAEIASALGALDASNPVEEAGVEEPSADEAGADEAEEIDEFEILAEADADDDDLLASHGEDDISGSGEVLPGDEFERRPSVSDFALRLDLGDESDLYAPPPEPGFYERKRNYSDQVPPQRDVDPRVLSAGHALAAFEDDQFDGLTPNPGAIPQPYTGRDQSESGFTHAGDLPADDFDAPHAFSPPHAFDQSDVIAMPPELLEPKRTKQPTPRSLEPAAPKGGPADDYDLETALEALDVDLDDISIPHASTELHREGSASQRIPGRPTIRPPGEHPAIAPPRGRDVYQSGSARVVGPVPIMSSGRKKRPPTDDGVMIDFDDDDEK